MLYPHLRWLDPHELTDFGFQNVIRNRASRKLPPHLRELRHLQGVAWPSIYRSTDAMNILNIRMVFHRHFFKKSISFG